MHVSASYIMLSKPYISIIELIKLVRVEYVLGRQRLNSFIFLFEEASACNASVPKQGRAEILTGASRGLVNKQARCIRPRARGRSHVGTTVLGCHHGMQ